MLPRDNQWDPGDPYIVNDIELGDNYHNEADDFDYGDEDLDDEGYSVAPFNDYEEDDYEGMEDITDYDDEFFD